MATLQNIRSEGPLLMIVIDLALFTFIAGGARRILQPYQSQDVGEVNGEIISVQDFQALVKEYTEVVKFSSGMNALSDEQTNQIKDGVWGTHMDDKLIENETEKLGLTASKMELQAIIDVGAHPMLQQTPFRNPQADTFDKDTLKKFLVDHSRMNKTQMPTQYAEYYESMYNFWAFVEKSLIQTRLQEKYRALITKSLFSNPVETEDAFDVHVDQSNLLLAVAPYSSVADSTIVIKESGLKETYDKKKEQFRRCVETRNTKYIDIQVTAGPEDKAGIQKEVEEYTAQLGETSSDHASSICPTGSTQQYTDLYYADKALPADIIACLDSVRVDEAYDPYYNASDDTINSFKKLATATIADSIQSRQIQITAGDDTKTRTLAGSVYNAIKGGVDFTEIARKYGQIGEPIWISSANYEGAQIDGDSLKYITAVTSLGQNELASLTLGQTDVILQVMNRKTVKNKYKVAVIRRPVEFSKETYNKAYDDFSQFTTTSDTLEGLAANAEDAGYRLLDRTDLYSSEHVIGGVKDTKEALRWASTAKVGEVSGLCEYGKSDHIMIVAITDIAPEGYHPLSMVKGQLGNEILRNEKAEKIMAGMKTTGATSFDQYKNMANAVNDSVRHVIFAAPAYVPVLHSNEPLVGTYASTAELNRLSTPIKGSDDVFVLQPYAKEKLSETYDQKTEETTLEDIHARVVGQFINDLYLKAEVKDNRYLYFQGNDINLQYLESRSINVERLFFICAALLILLQMVIYPTDGLSLLS